MDPGAWKGGSICHRSSEQQQLVYDPKEFYWTGSTL